MSSEIERLQQRLVEFRDARDWEQFHTPRNLSMALASEVGELLAELRWVTEDQVATDGELVARLSDEIADIGIFLLLLTESLRVDLAAAIEAKIERNEGRFPT